MHHDGRSWRSCVFFFYHRLNRSLFVKREESAERGKLSSFLVNFFPFECRKEQGKKGSWFWSAWYSNVPELDICQVTVGIELPNVVQQWNLAADRASDLFLLNFLYTLLLHSSHSHDWSTLVETFSPSQRCTNPSHILVANLTSLTSSGRTEASHRDIAGVNWKPPDCSIFRWLTVHVASDRQCFASKCRSIRVTLGYVPSALTKLPNLMAKKWSFQSVSCMLCFCTSKSCRARLETFYSFSSHPFSVSSIISDIIVHWGGTRLAGLRGLFFFLWDSTNYSNVWCEVNDSQMTKFYDKKWQCWTRFPLIACFRVSWC